MTGFVDLLIEPILWFIVAIITLDLGFFFIHKVIQAEKEAKPVLSGIMIYLFGYGISRLIETIRRYYIGSYYDIVDNNFSITGLNLILRLTYVILSWTTIAYFYLRVEGKIFEGKSFYILTFSSIMEGVLNVILYFVAFVPFFAMIYDFLLLLIYIFFFIAALFPIFMFSYFAVKRYGEKVVPWTLLAIGIFLFVLGVA